MNWMFPGHAALNDRLAADAARAPDLEAAREGVRAMLRLFGRDPDDPAVNDTPGRWVRAMLEMAGPTEITPDEVLSRRFDIGPVDSVVVVGPVTFVSVCEHHLLPFTGRAWVAYKPEGSTVVGLSKLPRLVRHYAAQLQVQERLTEQITAALDEHLETSGAACVIRAEHTCMTLRGVRAQDAVMTTSSLTGIFRTNAEARAEFLALTRD